MDSFITAPTKSHLCNYTNQEWYQREAMLIRPPVVIFLSCWFQAITLRWLQMCYIYRCLWTSQVENCSIPLRSPLWGGQNLVEVVRVEGGAQSPISARWWVYSSSLHRGPEAMTSHPFPYALIHFTFISSSNDSAAMKGRERRLKHLLGRSGIFLRWLQFVVLLENAARGYSYFKGHTGQGQQLFSPSHEYTALCNWHSNRWQMPKRTHACM